ncbi:MAG TPA: DMT family transporter [Anaerovoracaceae bacterium]|nr:DMT family transporter [Anaerovoracaceae bacterium]
MDSKKRNMYLLMTVLVFAWGIEYIFAKQALDVMEPLTLVFFKYLIGLAVCLAMKLKLEGRSLMRKKDIPLFLFCALAGEVGYFYLEYTAMGYLPVSLVTIILALVPALSIVIDKILYKKKTTKKIAGGVALSIVGVVLVIGMDWHILFQGRLIGYLVAFGAVLAWNLYNFLTASLHDRYQSITLTLNQIICSLLLSAPWALAHMPDPGLITAGVVGGVLFLGAVSTGIGFMIYVKSLDILGPTVTAIYSNFLPVTTTLFGLLILKETISPVQMAGGAVVIAAGCLVIMEKGRLEELPDDRTT